MISQVTHPVIRARATRIRDASLSVFVAPQLPSDPLAAMPEGPEIHWMSSFINKHARGGEELFSHVSRSALATHERKHPPIPIPESWEHFTIRATARGKELRVVLHGMREGAAAGEIPILFRAGMTGNFRLKEDGEEFEKHDHLRLHIAGTDRAICFVDPRRFGSWQTTAAWGDDEERGPDLVHERALAVENIRTRLDERVFDKPIGEVMLDQRFFNGVGNYLRAEILHRLRVSPFRRARDFLTGALEGSGGNLFDMIETVFAESSAILAKYGFTDDAERHTAFEDWLQCYSKLASTEDGIGRRIWYDPAVVRGDKRKGKRAAIDEAEDTAADETPERSRPAGARKAARVSRKKEAARVSGKKEAASISRKKATASVFRKQATASIPRKEKAAPEEAIPVAPARGKRTKQGQVDVLGPPPRTRRSVASAECATSRARKSDPAPAISQPNKAAASVIPRPANKAAAPKAKRAPARRGRAA
eukprot:m.24373 g.24373  ORF g.24373 m.24373 type:complete len:479 (+) comp4002_c0_seq1:226-1662(+)